MRNARKITLGQARIGGAVGLWLECETPGQNGNLCRHGATLSLSEALERWGAGRHLDALPLRCSRCGGRRIDVRPQFPPNKAS